MDIADGKVNLIAQASEVHEQIVVNNQGRNGQSKAHDRGEQGLPDAACKHAWIRHGALGEGGEYIDHAQNCTQQAKKRAYSSTELKEVHRRVDALELHLHQGVDDELTIWTVVALGAAVNTVLFRLFYCGDDLA